MALITTTTVPIRNFKEKLKTLLKDNITELEEVYTHFPKGSYAVPCVKADTLIDTSTGLKPIKDIKIGDIIEGESLQKVINTSKREYNGEIISIKPAYFERVDFTPEHPIMCMNIKRGWSKYHIGEKIWKKAKDVHKGDYLVIPKKNLIEDTTTIGLEKLTPELFEIFGWYLAEGYVSGNRIVFTLGYNEIENVKRLIKILEPYKTIKVSVAKEEYIYRICITNPALAEFIGQNFGVGCESKRLPSFVFKSPRDWIQILLIAYIKGDGHFDKNNRFHVASISKQLIKGIQHLLLKAGTITSFCRQKKAQITIIQGRICRCKESYCLQGTFENKRWNTSYIEDDAYWYIKVKDVSVSKYCGEVYNLETEEQIYCLPFIVHNCGIIYTLGMSDKVRWVFNDKRIYGYTFGLQIWTKTIEDKDKLVDKITLLLKDRNNFSTVGARDISLVGGNDLQTSDPEYKFLLILRALLPQD